MTKEYIDREAAIEIIDNYAKTMTIHKDTLIVYQAIRDIVDIICPTADVVEVVHGEWEIKSKLYRMMEDDFYEQLYVECPYCKRRFCVPSTFDDEEIIEYARENYPYCHCGAKMDGERKDER